KPAAVVVSVSPNVNCPSVTGISRRTVASAVKSMAAKLATSSVALGTPPLQLLLLLQFPPPLTVHWPVVAQAAKGDPQAAMAKARAAFFARLGVDFFAIAVD